MKRIWLSIKFFLNDRFSLEQDQDNETEIIDAIRKGVPFKGVNLWMLIFATIIASIGLNVNSTAVVIGAMLISPLMGPIMGLGLGAGINDIQLIQNAVQNLLIAVIFSVITSAVYFYFTPLTQAQSELLSRTSPTFWDVLIALFGGLAGVYAGSSKEKGNAIPGVAIATALMPPLCTAGYGLATLNMSYFFGALYLFFINSVMIGASTFAVVRFLNFRHVEYMDSVREKTVKRIIYTILFFTIVPSIYLGYNIVKQSAFEIDANTYLQNEFSNEAYYILNKQIEYRNQKENTITLYIGGYMDSLAIVEKKTAMNNYQLEECQLVIKQGTQLDEILEAEKNEMDQVNLAHIQEITAKDSAMALLKEEILENHRSYYSAERLLDEIDVFYPNVTAVSVSEGVIYSENDSVPSSTKLVFIQFEDKLIDKDFNKIESWLQQRLGTENVKIVKE